METAILAICCSIIEIDDGWDRPDGYLIAATEEELNERIKKLEEGNSPSYGLYEVRPQNRFKIALKPDKVPELETRRTVFVNNLSEYGTIL